MATKNKKSKKLKVKSPSKVTKLKSKAKTAKPKAAAKKTASKASPKPAGKVIDLHEARQSRAAAKIDWSQYLTPIDDRVLVEVPKPVEKTAGGLFIPDMAKERSNNGKVVAVGPGKRDKKGRRKPLDVRVGEKIMYVDYAGSKLELEGRNLLLINESDILGVLEP